MYYFLSLLTGVLITLMLALNGGLAEQYGIYSATVIIHVSGLIPIGAMVLIKGEKPFKKRLNWVLYLGGAIGVATTVFANFAFGRISVSAIMALGLLGQSVLGALVDQYGWLGMPSRPFRKHKMIGLLLIVGGIAVMVSDFEAAAVLVSFISGILIVTSRTLNARLAEQTSVRVSAFFNYLVGLAVAVPVLFALGSGEFPISAVFEPARAFVYLGGAIGMGVVLLSNMTVTKISALYLSLLLFIGQVFSGILIDALLSGSFSMRNTAGGLLVAIGLSANLLLDRKRPAV